MRKTTKARDFEPAVEIRRSWKLLSRKSILLGDFKATQFTIFDHKARFSLIIYYFSGPGWQDRFHDHAFNALSLCVFGSYRERLLTPETGVVEERQRGLGLRFFRRSDAHMLGHSKGCATILLAGPWRGSWREWKDGRERTLASGRQRISS